MKNFRSLTFLKWKPPIKVFNLKPPTRIFNLKVFNLKPPTKVFNLEPTLSQFIQIRTIFFQNSWLGKPKLNFFFRSNFFQLNIRKANSSFVEITNNYRSRISDSLREEVQSIISRKKLLEEKITEEVMKQRNTSKVVY